MGEVRQEFLQLARVDAVPDEAVGVEAPGMLQASSSDTDSDTMLQTQRLRNNCVDSSGLIYSMICERTT
jgi:hypothetical protein